MPINVKSILPPKMPVHIPKGTAVRCYKALDGTEIPVDIPGALESIAQLNRSYLSMENLKLRYPDKI